MAKKKTTKRKKAVKKKSGGVKSFIKAVNSNASLKLARKRLKHAEALKKAAYKKAVKLAKKKFSKSK